MTSIADGLFKSLPKPKYTGEEEELPQHAQPRGPRVVGADQLDETQVVLRVSAVPRIDLRPGVMDGQMDNANTLLREEDWPPSVRKSNWVASPGR